MAPNLDLNMSASLPNVFRKSSFIKALGVIPPPLVRWLIIADFMFLLVLSENSLSLSIIDKNLSISPLTFVSNAKPTLSSILFLNPEDFSILPVV